MSPDRIVDKLRKVLAMTNSPVEAEAQSAAEMLQRLLTQYNLDMADLESRGSIVKPQATEAGHDLGKAAFTWKLNLAETIADHYYCWSIVDRYAKTVVFIGRPENVESLKMLYAWIIDQIKRISSVERIKWQQDHNDHVDPLRWQVNFGLGVVSRLGARLADIRNSQASDVTSLVLSHRTEISDYMEEKYGRRVDGQKTKREMKYEQEWNARQTIKDELKRTDIEAYYRAYPSDRPLTPEQQVEQEKANAKWQRQWDAKQRRAANRPRRGMSDAEYRQSEQAYEANRAGRKSADKVNLEPFLKSGSTSDPKKLKGGN